MSGLGRYVLVGSSAHREGTFERACGQVRLSGLGEAEPTACDKIDVPHKPHIATIHLIK